MKARLWTALKNGNKIDTMGEQAISNWFKHNFGCDAYLQERIENLVIELLTDQDHWVFVRITK